MDGSKQLLDAAIGGNFGECVSLLESGVGDPMLAVSDRGTTVLHYLSRYKKKNFEHGEVDRRDFTELVAQSARQEEELARTGERLKELRRVVQLCLAKGADIAAKNADGVTSLHDAAFSGCAEVLHLLLNFHAPLDARNNAGETPLHFASRGNRVENARVLLTAGADATIKGHEGTCVDVATGEAMRELLEPFLECQKEQKRDSIVVARYYKDLPDKYKRLIGKMGISDEEATQHYKAVLHIVRQVSGTKIALFRPWSDMALVRREDVRRYYKFVERSARGGFGSVYFARPLPLRLSSDGHRSAASLVKDSIGAANDDDDDDDDVGAAPSPMSQSVPASSSVPGSAGARKGSDGASSSSSSAAAAATSSEMSGSTLSLLLDASERDRIDIPESVAIKQIKCKTAKDVKRALREVTMLARLNHPNIVRFHEAFFMHNEFWLIQEYLQGGSLKTVLDCVRLDERQTAHIAHKVFRALAHLHARGLVHRDLKVCWQRQSE
jgi:Protein kinase domain/Ankyrin repeats (3 copies)